MTESQIQPGDFVRDDRGKVGQVASKPRSVEISGNTLQVVSVDFWGDQQTKRSNSLTFLSPEDPEVLLWNTPEKLDSWAQDAPLKLVAVALSVSGHRGKAADIREKLDGRAIEGYEWAGWWRRVQPHIKKSENYFKVIELKKNVNEYHLLTNVYVVPEGPTILPPGPDSFRPKGTNYYEHLLEQQRQDHYRQLNRQQQEQELQRSDYESRLERQWLERERERADYESKLQELHLSHKIELLREQREQKWLLRRVEVIRNQLFSGYEHSKLDIRQDMLVIVGELSQLVGKQDRLSGDLLRDMRSRLSLALQAGGAKPLGVVGDITVFDPLKHQATASVRIGDSVEVIAPGVIVIGQRTDDRVLVKAQVSSILESG